MITEEIKQKVEELVKIETGHKVRPLFNLANKSGQILAEKLGADKDIVFLGTRLMDLKLKQAMAENKIKEHTQMSLDASKTFFEQFELDDEILKKIYNCIEAHHRTIPFNSIEAEICCNADCYKFLHPKGYLQYVGILMDRLNDFNKALEGVENKMDEKWNNLTLDICKEELKPYYNNFKEMIKKAREE